MGFKETSALKNPKFDNSKKDEDVEFDTCLPQWDTLMILYNMLHDKAQNLNYGSYASAKKDTSSEQKLGRPRLISEYIWRGYFDFGETYFKMI